MSTFDGTIRTITALRLAKDADFEAKHPRGDGGKFGDKGAESTATSASTFEKMVGDLHLTQLDGPFFAVFYKAGSATLEIKPLNEQAWGGKTWAVSLIAVPEKDRGKGIASHVLNQIIEAADKYGVILRATVDPQGEGGLTKAQLHAWYKRAGFERGRYEDTGKPNDQIVRHPRSSPPAPADSEKKM